jgi:hypothetical protein
MSLPILGERVPNTHCIGGWVAPQPVWMVWRREKSLTLMGIEPRFPDHPVTFHKLNLQVTMELSKQIGVCFLRIIQHSKGYDKGTNKNFDFNTRFKNIL